MHIEPSAERHRRHRCRFSPPSVAIVSIKTFNNAACSSVRSKIGEKTVAILNFRSNVNIAFECSSFMVRQHLI